MIDRHVYISEKNLKMKLPLALSHPRADMLQKVSYLGTGNVVKFPVHTLGEVGGGGSGADEGLRIDRAISRCKSLYWYN